MGWTFKHEAKFGWTKTPAKSYEKALELGEKALELGKKALSLNESDSGPCMLFAFVYADTGQTEKALKAAKKSLSLDPNLSERNWGCGYIFYTLGRFKEAIPLIEKSVSLDPLAPHWYIRYLAWSYLHMGKKKEAILILKKEINRRPSNAWFHAGLGCALIADGKPGEGVVEFDKALSLNPHYLSYSPGWYIGNRAVALVGIGKPEEAITTMQDLINRLPDDAYGYRFFSCILMFEGRYEEALQTAKKAVSLEEMRPSPWPDAAGFYLFLGAPYLMMGQYEEAIAAFKKAISLWPDYVYAHINLTAAYSMAGRMEEAHAEAAEVLKINPKITLEDIAENGYYNYKKADTERFIKALRKAGLK